MPQMNQRQLASGVNGKCIDFGAFDCSYTPIDLETFAMNNSFPKKKLVGRTYAGVVGYCPFAVYLGRLGNCLELTLRPGVQHSAGESQYNFERALPMADLVATPLLVRSDSDFCSLKLMQEIAAMNLLRLIGQNTSNGSDSPMRHSDQRRYIKTVMREMMFKAARMITHTGRWFLDLGASERDFAVFERHYWRLSTA